MFGDPLRTRTPNLLIRSQLLYPVELRDRCLCSCRSGRLGARPVALRGKDLMRDSELPRQQVAEFGRQRAVRRPVDLPAPAALPLPHQDAPVAC